jgi:hypothetical protein
VFIFFSDSFPEEDIYLATGTDILYYYRFTAEYDDGKLGESGPSTAVAVRLLEEIDLVNTHTLTMNPADDRYNMAMDATKIHIYRTVKGADSDGVYYRVGSVTLTDGAPTGTFVDNITDAVLVGKTMLDEDVFLPPKYKTATFWKDRMVIGHLKARDTSATEGTELDLTQGGYHPNRIRFSNGFLPDRFPANYFIDVDIGGETATVRKLIVNRRLDALLVFLEDSSVLVTGDTPLGERGSPFRPQHIPFADGTPSPDSVVEDGEGNIFAWTKAGIQVFEGASVRYITDNTIKPLWAGMSSSHALYAQRIEQSQINLVKGVYVPGEEKILWAYPVASGTRNTNILVLDLTMWRATGRRDGVFSMIVNRWQVSSWSVWGGEGDANEVFSGESSTVPGPWVYRVLFGDDDQAGDLVDVVTTLQINSVLHLGHANFRRPDMLRAFKNLVMEVDSGGTAPDSTSFAVTMNVDDHGTDVSLGAWVFDRTTGGINRLVGGIPRATIGRRASLKFTTSDTSSPRPWELHTVSWETEELPTRRRP